MLRKISIISLIISFGILLTQGAMAKQENTPSAHDISTISEMAKLKVALLDLHYNLLGLGWADRDRMNVGRQKLASICNPILDRLIDKKINPSEISWLPNMPAGIRSGGSSTEKGNIVYISLPNDAKWYQLLACNTKGTNFPKVEFSGGGISINLDKATVSFWDKTMVKYKGRVYVYSKATKKWNLQK